MSTNNLTSEGIMQAWYDSTVNGTEPTVSFRDGYTFYFDLCRVGKSNQPGTLKADFDKFINNLFSNVEQYTNITQFTQLLSNMQSWAKKMYCLTGYYQEVLVPKNQGWLTSQQLVNRELTRLVNQNLQALSKEFTTLESSAQETFRTLLQKLHDSCSAEEWYDWVQAFQVTVPVKEPNFSLHSKQ